MSKNPSIYLNQGYQEVDSVGFGYFGGFDLLKNALEQYNIPKGSVIAFSWKGEIDLLSDITDEATSRLK